MRIRRSEWVLLLYFTYVAFIAYGLPHRRNAGLNPRLGWCIAVLAVGFLWIGDRKDGRQGWSIARDWAPLALTLLAFRELDWFTVLQYSPKYEHAWLKWDQFLLVKCRMYELIVATHYWGPSYLEFCYLLVYSVGAVCITFLYLANGRAQVDRWLVTYLAGTLAAYALIPYFPSLPPRILFAGVPPEPVSGAIRQFNLWVLREGTIHSGVFPSAHVSSVFSAAWGMFQAAPARSGFAWILVAYAVSVAVATVYGRYHYAVDALAGFGISVIAALITGYVLPKVRKTRQAAH